MTASLRPSEPDPEPWLRVRLYVAGASPNSAIALANLRSALALCPPHRIDLEIIDILDDPERGVADGVLVTPTLVKREPLPERRLLGSLRDRAVLLAALDLQEERRG